MQLPPINNISKEQIPGAPDWFQNFLYPINELLNSLVPGLNKNITYSQNLDTDEKTFSITAGATPADNVFLFVPRKFVRPKKVEILYQTRADGINEVYTAAPYLSWSYTNQGISIYAISGLTAGVRYNITVGVLFT